MIFSESPLKVHKNWNVHCCEKNSSFYFLIHFIEIHGQNINSFFAKMGTSVRPGLALVTARTASARTHARS